MTAGPPGRVSGSACSLIVVLACMWISGCLPQAERAQPAQPPGGGPNLDAALLQAKERQLPIMVVVAEDGRSPADDEVMARFRNGEIRSHLGTTLLIVLDLGISRLRAETARFHIADVPLLIVISSRGIIESRDEAPFDDALVMRRLMYAEHIGFELDTRLAELEEHVAALPDDLHQRMKLIKFLISRRNASEAIPHLALVRTSEQADLPLRIQAAVEEAQAHFWIGEPEKGRHVAEELIATLGAQSPEARCAGYYALGAQDALGRHRERGLHELDQAITTAPDSEYGTKARAERDKYTSDRK